jgi:hypothetical protein
LDSGSEEEVDPKVVEPIKEFIRPGLNKALEHLMGAFLKDMEPAISKTLGPKEFRVFSSGPSTPNGKEIAEAVASKIASLGYVGMTEDAYFLPSHSQKKQKLVGAAAFFIQLTSRMSTQMYSKHLPRLAAKAVFYENKEGDKVVQLEGCSEFNIPRLGYVLHPEIYRTGKGNRALNSTYLAPSGRYSECKAADPALCGHNDDGLFCPFHEAMRNPWPSLSFYLVPSSTLVAVESLDDLMEPLKLFLGRGVDKPSLGIV